MPFLESLDALIAMQAEGKIRHLALSNVSVREIEEALARTPIVAVQNMFNVSGGGGAIAKYTHSEVDDPEGVLDLCTRKNIAYLPFFPLAVGNVAQEKPALAAIADKHGASPAQIALAWLLARSPVMLPIPGTGSRRAPRGELGRAPHRAVARGGGGDREASVGLERCSALTGGEAGDADSPRGASQRETARDLLRPRARPHASRGDQVSVSGHRDKSRVDDPQDAEDESLPP